MNFELLPTEFFLNQIKKLNKKEKNLINQKLNLLKENPARFKSLKGYKNTFEIKLTLRNTFSRLIYCLYLPQKHQITIFGIFKRNKDFKDFKKFVENYF